VAVPTRLGANIIDVRNWVMPKQAPTIPRRNRNSKNDAELVLSPISIMGIAPTTSSVVYVNRGPSVSHSLPINKRAMIVAETEAMMMLPTSLLVKPSSSRIMGINGATPNHPKKQKKKVIHVIWNVFIWMPLNEKMLSLVSGCWF